jgi:hypothetical protein
LSIDAEDAFAGAAIQSFAANYLLLPVARVRQGGGTTAQLNLLGQRAFPARGEHPTHLVDDLGVSRVVHEVTMFQRISVMPPKSRLPNINPLFAT